jgi:hypothetical protein
MVAAALAVATAMLVRQVVVLVVARAVQVVATAPAAEAARVAPLAVAHAAQAAVKDLTTVAIRPLRP